MNAPPLIVFAYKRADLLTRALAAIRSPSIPVIYAFSDAPKSVGDAAAVADVRRVLRAVDWVEVRVVERTENMGPDRSVLDGVTAVFRDHGAAVILEDDIEVTPGTYEWFAAALEHYAADARVMNISAWTHPRVTPRSAGGRPFFSGRAGTWGWATWARAWRGMPDRTLAEIVAEIERSGRRSDEYGLDITSYANANLGQDPWDMRFIAHQVAHHGLGLHPGVTYARHIGWDARATHRTDRETWDSELAPAAEIPGQWPEPAENPDVAALWQRVTKHEHAVAAARGVPARIQRRLTRVASRLRVILGRLRRDLRLDALRSRLVRSAPGSVVTLPGGIALRITDGANAYMQYKDEIVRRNHAFTADRPDPVVIDGGANMGMFSIATKRDHPGARITAFEPDPRLLALLRENLERNGVRDVTLVDAALGASDGDMAFSADGRAAGALVGGQANAPAIAATRVHVRRLSAYLTHEVDFLKLNIEGAEHEVLREAADAGRLRNVKAMVFEYHGWPDGEQRLGAILSLLDAQGFRYFVHDLDDQTNPATKPPFRPPGRAPWFALVYAWRVGSPGGEP